VTRPRDPLALSFEGVTKRYATGLGLTRREVLSAVTFALPPGRTLGLVGPNGSGKSTTIKLLLGLLRPTAGEARIFGFPPGDIRARAILGYLPEENVFYDYLTAEETLWFYGNLFSIPSGELARRVDRLLGLVGLEGARRRRVGEFSKGMQRRIGLAQALINDPQLLILDEPTAGLDPMGTREVKILLRDLKAAGKTVVLSSHLLADVEEVCDRVAILHQGSLQAVGDLASILRDDQRLQITTGKLSPATIDALLSLLREREGAGLEVHLGSPTTRLEDFFVKTVTRRQDSGASEA